MSSSPPVVFLGPSCPVDDVTALLPDAVVVPPVQRGDLYRHRILKHTLFIIIDGVFANEPSVSPREVVDVLDDGAMIVGASSMGALRAADCAPAGAVGIGQVYRLFKRGSISSEDEVAVVFSPDRPYPSLSESLVNMRIALRRATRSKLLTADQSERLMSAARSTHYTKRSWRAVFAEANVSLSSHLATYLSNTDAKREDACRAFRWVASRRSNDNRPLGAARLGSNVFGLLDDGRERSPDPLDGEEVESVLVDLFKWIIASGQIHKLPTRDLDPLLELVSSEGGETLSSMADYFEDFSSSPDFDAIQMRFSVFQKAHNHAQRLGLRPRQNDLSVAEREIVHAHAKSSWHDLVKSYTVNIVISQFLEEYRYNLALTKCLKALLFPTKELNAQRPAESFVWRR